MGQDCRPWIWHLKLDTQDPGHMVLLLAPSHSKQIAKQLIEIIRQHGLPSLKFDDEKDIPERRIGSG